MSACERVGGESMGPKHCQAAASRERGVRRRIDFGRLGMTCVDLASHINQTACRAALSWADIAFTSWCGLRGAVSLIMVADFVSNRWVGGRVGWSLGLVAPLQRVLL